MLEKLLGQITLQCHWDTGDRVRIRKGFLTTSTDRLYLRATAYRCIFTHVKTYHAYICVQYGLLNVYDLYVRARTDTDIIAHGFCVRTGKKRFAHT